LDTHLDALSGAQEYRVGFVFDVHKHGLIAAAE